MTNPPNTLSLESLKSEIDFLASQLAKSTRVVADTGRRVLAMELDHERQTLNSLNPPNIPGLDSSATKLGRNEPDNSTSIQIKPNQSSHSKNSVLGVDKNLSQLPSSSNVAAGADQSKQFDSHFPLPSASSQQDKTLPKEKDSKQDTSSGTEQPKLQKSQTDRNMETSIPANSKASLERPALKDLISGSKKEQESGSSLGNQSLNKGDFSSPDDILAKLMELTKSSDLKPQGKPVPREEELLEQYGQEQGAEAQENEYVTGDDIVELVTELQGQLDLLESRSIRRQANGFVINENDPIAPLPSTDGSIPNESFVVKATESSNKTATKEEEEEEPLPTATELDESLYYLSDAFPQTFGQFKSLSAEAVEEWCKFYELLPPDDSEMQALLAAAGATVKSLGGSYALSGDKGSGSQQGSIPKKLSDQHFDALARFLGLRARRTKGAW